MMDATILKLNKAGAPQAWIDPEAATLVAAKGLVFWTIGGSAAVLRGGFRDNGERSQIDIPEIIAVAGPVKETSVPRLTNALLFSRDAYLCLYCAKRFARCDLSRDPVMPRSRGGADSWTNCVTAVQAYAITTRATEHQMRPA